MEMEITLGAGLTTRDAGGGEETAHRDCVLRRLSVGDVLDAELAAERIFPSEAGPTVMSSPAVLSIELLRRRVRRIGTLEGPIPLTLFRRLSRADFEAIGRAAAAMDAAEVCEEAGGDGRGRRGRDPEPTAAAG